MCREEQTGGCSLSNNTISHCQPVYQMNFLSKTVMEISLMKKCEEKEKGTKTGKNK